MKKILYAFMMLFIGLSFAACGGDDDEEESDVPGGGGSVEISYSEKSYGLKNNDAVTLNFSFTANENWRATCDADWVKVTPAQGTAGNNSVSISVSENTKPEERTAEIHVNAISGSAKYAKITVNQPGKEPVPPLDNTATQLTKKLGWGWNLGNHFDTSSDKNGQHPQWGYWDKATPTQQLYDNLKKAGASTVRICVTWGNYQTVDENWTIESDYMADVKKNVEMAENAGLNVILNLHHDEYWLDIKGAANNAEVNSSVKNRIEKTWKQIAETFKDKGDFLLFESFNEVQDGNWGWGANKTDGGKQYRTLNEWNQLVVNTIRATGGNNSTRWIGVPGYASSPTFVLDDSFVLPTDAANRVMVSVHFYDPDTFTLTPENSNGKSEWGHTAAAGKFQSGSNEEHVVDVFSKLQEKFIANNIPVYIGEYGCVMHNTDRSNLFRNYYLEYVCRAAHTYNMPLIIWDNNSIGGGNEHHGYFDHNNGGYLNNLGTLVQTMIKAATVKDENYTLETIYNKAP